jgi:hypothetical protein
VIGSYLEGNKAMLYAQVHNGRTSNYKHPFLDASRIKTTNVWEIR